MENYALEILKNENSWLTEVLKEKEKENASAVEIKELENKIMSIRVALNKLA